MKNLTPADHQGPSRIERGSNLVADHLFEGTRNHAIEKGLFQNGALQGVFRSHSKKMRMEVRKGKSNHGGAHATDHFLPQTSAEEPVD